MVKKRFLIIVLGQFLIIFFLFNKIYDKKKNIKGVMNVNPIKKESIISSPSGVLKYYYEHKPNIVLDDEDWKGLYDGTYNINADGLREDRDYSIDKTVGTFRIIALGDSFTFGDHVSVESSWPKVLEKKLNALNCSKISNFEVINLGMGGYDIQYAVRRYQLHGQKYNPDLVVWFLKDDDISTINEIFFKNNQKYEREMRESGEYDEATKAGSFHPVWVKMLKDMEKKYQELGEEKIHQLQKMYLNELRDNFSKNLLLFTLPSSSEQTRQFLKSYAEKSSDTFYIDNIRDIYKLNATYLPIDGHPNVKGHKIIAEDLLVYLTKKTLIPCN